MELEKTIEELKEKTAELGGQVQPIKINESNLKAEVIQVIHTSINRGDGSTDNPIRTVNQYWSLNGELLAEKDSIH